MIRGKSADTISNLQILFQKKERLFGPSQRYLRQKAAKEPLSVTQRTVPTILSFLFCCDNICHIVVTTWFSRKEFGRFHGTLCKYCLGICSVLEFYDLVLSAEEHLMFSHNIATSYRRDTNLVFVSLLSYLTSVIDVIVFSVQGFIHGVCKGDGCSARCIQL